MEGVAPFVDAERGSWAGQAGAPNGNNADTA